MTRLFFKFFIFIMILPLSTYALYSNDKAKVLIQLSSQHSGSKELWNVKGTSIVRIKKNEKLLGKIVFTSSDVSYKIYNLDGIKKPLIIFIANDAKAAGGSYYTIYPYSIFKKNIKLLNSANEGKWKSNNYGGGFYLGKIPNEPIMGAIIWEYIMTSHESRVDPHRYLIQIYTWNGKQFVFSRKLITKNKYTNDQQALKEYKLLIRDMSLDFKNLNNYR